jgi:hypothetical protein
MPTTVLDTAKDLPLDLGRWQSGIDARSPQQCIDQGIGSADGDQLGHVSSRPKQPDTSLAFLRPFADEILSGSLKSPTGQTNDGRFLTD